MKVSLDRRSFLGAALASTVLGGCDPAYKVSKPTRPTAVALAQEEKKGLKIIVAPKVNLNPQQTLTMQTTILNIFKEVFDADEKLQDEIISKFTDVNVVVVRDLQNAQTQDKELPLEYRTLDSAEAIIAINNFLGRLNSNGKESQAESNARLKKVAARLERKGEEGIVQELRDFIEKSN